MWKYIRKYLLFAIIAGLFMIGEVMMDLVQPGFMSRIVDDGVLGVNNGGSADLPLIWMLGLQMIGTCPGGRALRLSQQCVRTHIQPEYRK